MNHVLIFELDPRNHLSEQHLMELAAILGVVWTLSVLTFLYSQHMAIPAYVNPLALVVIMVRPSIPRNILVTLWICCSADVSFVVVAEVGVFVLVAAAVVLAFYLDLGVSAQLVFMLNPTKTFRYEARFWMLRVLFRIACAPFFYVGFADFWVADQLNSLAVALVDFHYLACFYISKAAYGSGSGESSNGSDGGSGDWGTMMSDDVGHCSAGDNWVRAVVMALPAWFRFAQCCRRYRDTREAFPHLVNAGKYSTTFFVVLFATLRSWKESGANDSGDSFSAFFYPWVLAAIVSTLYAYAWDILMDWGLFDSNAGENKCVKDSIVVDIRNRLSLSISRATVRICFFFLFSRLLREEIVYSSKGYYYFAILEDLTLR